MIGNKLEPFKFWCQKVLPNVYDDSLSYYEYLCKLNEYLNEVIGQINTLTDNMSDYEEDLTATWLETKEYIDNYFNNLDVQQEINNKLDQMASSGALSILLAPIVGTQIGGVVAEQIGGTVANQIGATVASQIDDVVAEQIATPTATAVTAWLNENVDPVGSAVTVDKTLTITGSASDAKVTGDKIKNSNTFSGYVCEQLINTNKLRDITTQGTETDYWLNDHGMGISQSGYTFRKFTVGGAKYLYVNIPYSNSPTSFRFCATAAGNGEVVGELFKTGYKGIISVPTNGNYLFACCQTVDLSNLSVKSIDEQYDETMEDLIHNINTFCTQNGEQIISTSMMNEVPVRNTESGYWLKIDGKGGTQSGYSFNKYGLNSLKYLYVDIPNSYSPSIFRFSANAAGNSDVIGELYKTGYKGFLTVPSGAGYLFVACDNEHLSNIKIYGTSNNVIDMLNSINIGTRFTVVGTTDDSNANFWLNENGGGEASSGYTFDEYPVQEGETLYINVPFCKSPTLFRFSNSGSGSSSSVVGDLHKTPYRGFIDVPTGANHLFIAHTTGDTSIKVYKLDYNNKKNAIVRGLVWINKHNNKVYIKTTNNYYVLLNGTATYVGEKDIAIDDSNNFCNVVATKTSFKITNLAYKPTNEELIIATIAYGNVLDFVHNVIPNDSPVIKNWYQRTDIPTFFNNKKQWNYQMKKAPSNRAINCDYFIKFTNAYENTNVAMYYEYENNYNNVDYPKFYQNTTSIANKSILTIGDSFTKRGWYQQQIKDRENTVTFVGTQATNHNNLMCEGYSGARSDEVFGSTLLGNPSPFYNPDTHQVDYEYYVTTQGINADIIVVMFGLNENNANNYFTAIQNFVDSVHNYNTNIPVYVVQPCIESDAASSTQESYYYDNVQYKCGVAWIDLTNCIKVPMRHCMIDEYDYDYGELSYGYNNVKIKGTTDAVHPSEDVGFKKIGDHIYNWLGV